MSSFCINPWDTKKTLRSTFQYIYHHQNLNGDNYLETIIYLAPALKKSQDFNNYTNRDEVFNIIYGKVFSFNESQITMEVPSLCINEKQYYTIAYNDISTFRSEVITQFYDDYIAYMASLPPLCKCSNSTYYSLLRTLNFSLNKLSLNELLHLIYSGRFSYGYSKTDYHIVRNLIIIQKNGVIPITSVGGFFITPDSETFKLQNALEKYNNKERCI